MSSDILERNILRQPHSLQELRPLHVKLLKSWSGLDVLAKIDAGILLRRLAVKSGRWIKDPDERDSTQGIIDYWTATMAGLPDWHDDGQFDTLAEFDQATVRARDRAPPYVGLSAFTVEDCDRFFGREAARAELLALLEERPLVVVAGPSGRGKSSLIQAGVAATLLQRHPAVVLPVVTPGRDPMAALLRAARPKDFGPDWLEEARKEVERRPERFRLMIEEQLDPEAGAVLVIDRAEELFTSDLSTAEIASALALVRDFVSRDPLGRHRALIAIRGDHLDQLRTCAQAAGQEIDEGAIYALAPPTMAELESAIVGPAQRIGFVVEPRVVEHITGDLEREPDALPLLQFTMTRLWNSAEIDRIGWNDYAPVGRPCRIIQDTAERIYGGLGSPQAMDTARCVFLALIRVGQHISRRRCRRDDLLEAVRDDENDGSQLAKVLDAFVKEGLIRHFPAEEAGDARFEIAHEVVIRHWPRLLVWLQERRRQTEARERLLASLERWRASGKSVTRLLTGHALKEGLVYRGTSRAVDEFLRLSRRWRVFRISLAGAVVVLFAGWAVWSAIDARALIQEVSGLAQRESQAASNAFEEGALGADFRRQAELAEHSLLRLVESGLIEEAALPDPLLKRARLRPPGSFEGFGGYDPNFLGPTEGAGNADSIPLPSTNSRSVRPVHYPHLTILYDVRRRVPLVAATNYDSRGEPLRPFPAIGSFPDPRVPAEQQSSDRVSANSNHGRVPLVPFQEVAWSRSRTSSPAAFLNYAPISVLQPWSFYMGAWSRLETQLLGSADRITFFTGPLLPAGDPAEGAPLVPTAYWKIALFRDAASGALVSQAYIVPADAAPEVPLAELRTTVQEVARRSGIDFGALMRSAPNPAGAAASPAAERAMPTVYVQFAVMPRWRAIEISRALADQGYVVPGQERVASAKNLLEVRHGNGDGERARELAERTRAALLELGYPDRPVRVVPLRRGPPPGVLELWIGIPPPASDRNPANNAPR